MEALLANQRVLIAELDRLLRNYKHDGPSRKTKPYLQEKLTIYGELFAKIRRNDEKLDPFVSHSNTYWAEKMFDKISNTYEKVRDDIEKRLANKSNVTLTDDLHEAEISGNSDDELGKSQNLLENNILDDNAAKTSDSIENADQQQHQNAPPGAQVDGASVGNSENMRDSLLGNGAVGNGSGNNNNFTEGTPNPLLERDSSNISDDLMIPYDELMDFIFATEELSSKTTRGVAQTHLDLLTSAWTEFRAAMQAERTAKRNIGLNYSMILRKYIAASGKLNDLLKGSNVTPNASSSSQLISLPKIKLPEFHGKITEWKAFISLFNKMVHNNPSADNDMKIEYLKTCIKGEAAKIINHLDPTPENYLTCYDLLLRRYDNKRELLGKFINNMLLFPKIKHESSESLKNLHDTIYESVMSIKGMGISTANWDFLLTHILMRKLDSNTVINYECQLVNVREPQKLENFLKYIENRFMALQSASAKTSFEKNAENKPENKSSLSHSSSSFSNSSKKCSFCDSATDHVIYTCPNFQKKSPEERFTWVKSNKLCINCLGDSHKVNSCKSKYKCKHCKKAHNTLLHLENKPKPDVEQVRHVQANVSVRQTKSVLLATALIGVVAKNGERIMLRALFDQGSTSAFVTENAAQTIALPRNKIHAVVSGIGNKEQIARQSIDLTVVPRFQSDFSMLSEAIILPKLTKISHGASNSKDFEFVNNLTLADPSFLNESDVDIILGAAEYAQAIKLGLVKSDKLLIAQNTEFGWIVSGAISGVESSLRVVSLVTYVELEKTLKQFFGSEEFENEINNELSDEQLYCERHFKENCYQNGDGRFVVGIPFKNGLTEPDLGDSRNRAVAAQFQLERRFAKNPKLGEEYSKHIREAIELGHIEEAPYVSDKKCHYLPHHCVFKDSTTTALRVVYNASQKTSNGKSLNQQLAIGHVKQSDLTSLLVKFRFFKHVFTADIEKMYKQILVNEEQRDLQRFVYRFSPNEPMKEYRLKTVTFGMANAPYIAIRMLQALAERVKDKYPVASSIILSCMYMDDVLGGCHSVNDLFLAYEQLKATFDSACMNLRKWCSNSSDLLNRIPECDREAKAMVANVKALGISWSAINDVFTYDFHIKMDTHPDTKRKITSEVASLFDPLGWISPVIIKAKRILQSLWKSGLGWDAELSDEFIQSWLEIKSELHFIKNLKISRWINYNPNDILQLHGFCDASEVGYAAAIYVRNVTEKTVHLLIAKARVAPLKEDVNKENVTIPRLELCGALLLSKLMKLVLNAAQFSFDDVVYWSDSKVVLGWINGNPDRYKKFIATKIRKINEFSDKNGWHHVDSANNAADCASRGLLPSQLVSHPIWWHGPNFLHGNELKLSSPNNFVTDHEKEVVVASANVNILPDISSFYELKKCMAYVLRFIWNCRKKNKENKRVGVLTMDEMEQAQHVIVKMVQCEFFGDEISILTAGKSLPKTNKLAALSPFIDDFGLLRVGGRISKADLPFDAKHQILLPRRHPITSAIIKQKHVKCKHGGPKLTESVFRQKYWISDSQRAIKSVLHHCIDCFKTKPRPMQQYMADLPANRVNAVEKPFSNTALDYTGCISIKLAGGRGHKSQKAYISIFVCMATKAIHLELVSELTAAAFIAAFRRFVARRGAVRNLYSDNGTNFVSANKILQENADIEEEEYHAEVCNELRKNDTKWHFSPAGAPHFNGLAEAAVKTVKMHLLKTIGDTKLTYEEMCTLLAQIEACVNSRPLCQLSSSPDDISALTPAHFLVGESLVAPPEPNHLESNVNWLTRWQRVQRMAQYFWSRWQADYLNQLQMRSKWLNKNANGPNVNELVLIRDENLPSTQWKRARVIDVHPGTDALTRVVTLKTENNILKRPIVKICPLPIDSPDVEVNSNVVRVTKRNAPRMGVLPLITALLALCVTVTHQSNVNEPFEVTKFDSSPGLYFEKMSDIYTVGANWNVLAYLHVEALGREFASIENDLSTAKSICFDKLTERTGCRSIVALLEQRVQRLQQKNKLIFQPHRAKRATLDFIGNIADDLFGVMGPRFKDRYNRDMKIMSQSRDTIKALLSNHTSILESTLNILKHDQDEFQKQSQHFRSITNRIQSLQNLEEVEQSLNDALLYLTQVTNEYERQQTAILHVIADSHRDLINHGVLTPQQIEDQVEIIVKQVGSRYIVPGGVDVYSLASIRPYFSGVQFIFKITIPLLRPQVYKMYRIVPVPIISNNGFLWVKMEHKQFITSADHQVFQFVDNMNVAECHEFRDALVCNEPKLWFTADKHDCVWSIFNENSLENCVFEKGPKVNSFIELDHNKMIFVCIESIKISAFCDGSITHHYLSGEGILRTHNCSIRGANMHLYPSVDMGGQEPTKILIPKVDIVQDKIKLSHQEVMRDSFHFVRANFTEIDSKLNATKFKIEDLGRWDRNYHDYHHYTLIYVLFTCLIIYLVCKFKSWFGNWQQSPVPAPRVRRNISAGENVGSRQTL